MPHPPSPFVIARAKELRARNWGWDTIAEHVGCSRGHKNEKSIHVAVEPRPDVPPHLWVERDRAMLAPRSLTAMAFGDPPAGRSALDRLGRRIAIAHTYDELIRGLRQRADELKISRETIDAVSGLQSGYAGKLLAPVPIRTLSRTSLGAMLGALGVMVVIVEDVEALARIQKRLTKRRRKAVDANRTMLTAKRRKRHRFPNGSDHARLMRQRGILKIPAERRSQIAARAARIRWRSKRAKPCARLSTDRRSGPCAS